MMYTIDTEKLTASQPGGDVVHEFKNLKELIAFLIPEGWQKKDYDRLYLQRLSLSPQAESSYLPAKEFAFIHNLNREYVYELAGKGEIDVINHNGKKLFCFKTVIPKNGITLYTREQGIIEKNLKKVLKKTKK